MANPSPFAVADLLYLMQRLRDPQSGCPWDLKQSYRSITSSTIEEAYEVVDAIERDDFVHLQEELGDLLFQVIFYSQLAQEEGHFDFAGVVDCLTAKLIRRHPHVFPDGTIESKAAKLDTPLADEKVKGQWEDLKARERLEKGRKGILDDVPLALPALTRAAKLQKRAAQVGFDWPTVTPVIAKIKEEIGELEQALADVNEESISDELGDVLFSVVNLARHLKRDPEHALRLANQKFIRRFEYVESSLIKRGYVFEQVGQDVLEQLWLEAKNTGL